MLKIHTQGRRRQHKKTQTQQAKKHKNSMIGETSVQIYCRQLKVQSSKGSVSWMRRRMMLFIGYVST